MKDYAISTVMVAPSPLATGSHLTVQTGHGQRFPSPPFKISVYPNGSMPTLDTAEKMLVTAVNGDQFTVVRAQGDTSAKFVQEGWIVSNSLFTEDVGKSAYDTWIENGNSGSEEDFLANLKGDKGDKGDKGETGPVNSLSIGSVTSGSASASITGDAPSQVLNLVLPKGDKGDQGIQGPMGVGVPTGGAEDQVLVKQSGNDYDFAWETPAGAGDMLKSVYDPAMKQKQVAFDDEKVGRNALTDSLPSTVGTNGQVLKSNGTTVTWQTDVNTTYTEIPTTEIDAGTASTARAISGRRAKYLLDLSRDRATHTGSQTASTISDFQATVSANANVAAATSHVANTSNPHSVTKSQVGLGNVDNTSDATKNSATATLTNKTINASNNNISNIGSDNIDWSNIPQWDVDVISTSGNSSNRTTKTTNANSTPVYQPSYTLTNPTNKTVTMNFVLAAMGQKTNAGNTQVWMEFSGNRVSPILYYDVQGTWLAFATTFSYTFSPGQSVTVRVAVGGSAAGGLADNSGGDKDNGWPPRLVGSIARVA